MGTSTGWNWPRRDPEEEALPRSFALSLTVLYTLIGAGPMAASAVIACGNKSAGAAQGGLCEAVVRDHRWLMLVVVPVAGSLLVGHYLRPEHRRFGWLLIAIVDALFVTFVVAQGFVGNEAPFAG